MRRRSRLSGTWWCGASPRAQSGRPSAPPFTGTRRIRRWIRTGALLTVIGLMPLARARAGPLRGSCWCWPEGRSRWLASCCCAAAWAALVRLPGLVAPGVCPAGPGQPYGGPHAALRRQSIELGRLRTRGAAAPRHPGHGRCTTSGFRSPDGVECRVPARMAQTPMLMARLQFDAGAGGQCGPIRDVGPPGPESGQRQRRAAHPGRADTAAKYSNAP